MMRDRSHSATVDVVTVTPNPAIDWTVTVPGFRAGTVNRASADRSQPAGKGVNVAAALAGYGVRAAATGFLGRDNAGAFESFFARTGIEDAFVRVAGSTRVGIKLVDPERQETTDVNFPGAAVSAADVDALFDAVDARAADGRWFVLAGSLPPGAPPTLYADLARRIAARGGRVALDTSGDALRHALEAAPSVVKPNVHELQSLVGTALASVDDVMDAARGLLEGGVELAAVSMGAEGALFVAREGVVLARPPSIDVGSSVGAGDAMVAGIVAARLAGLDLVRTARLATGFSLAALTRADAAPATRDAVEAMARRVEVETIG
ncbi:1-phosphofructokinase [Longimicrobium sp.]|uniref:1-phosphofructokinase n=1 Tax=Longimicrobium sp. TaxID=2029185 RepID=UPI002E2F765E|nr:1-phosphofructokinase [Longimicrobium sp.]